MSEGTLGTTVPKPGRQVLNFFIAFSALFTILFAIHWYHLSKSLKSIKDQNSLEYKSLLSKRNFEPFEIEFTKLNKKQVLIDPAQIAKINAHINVLSEQVYRESNRAESLIDKDLDRLNLYMAIGIGFMTLLGIFVPVLVNVLSLQDLRDKVKEMPSKDVINELTKKSDKALLSSNKVGKLSTDIDNLILKSDLITPKLSTISLQIAINRLFNVGPTAITRIVRMNDFTVFKSLFENIKTELHTCQNDDLHKIHNNESLKQTILDFSTMLNEEKFKFTSFLTSRNVVQEFDNLSESLIALAQSTSDTEQQNCEETLLTLDKIVNAIH